MFGQDVLSTGPALTSIDAASAPLAQDGSTQGLRLGINPDSHPWADAADGGPEAR